VATVVARVFPTIADVNTLLENPQAGLPKLEVRIKREMMKQCTSTFVGTPFHIGLPLAFLVLSDLEIQDLVVMIEAKSSDITDEDMRSVLLKTNLQN
jgi:vacuolar-type H+-ATPase subunit C/Vma6